MNINRYSIIILLAAVAPWAYADLPRPLDVVALDFEPRVDGDLAEWQGLKPYLISISPAIENDSKNRTGTIQVELRVGIP